jgi:hypothetical protein
VRLRWSLMVAVSVLTIGCDVPAGTDAEGLTLISSSIGWQATEAEPHIHDSISIEYISGEWHDQDTVLTGGIGSGYICGAADCCEPMPYERRAALIGRIGDGEPFLVGNGDTFQDDFGGRLFLRINDCDEGLYDNSGTIKVRITISEHDP